MALFLPLLSLVLASLPSHASSLRFSSLFKHALPLLPPPLSSPRSPLVPHPSGPVDAAKWDKIWETMVLSVIGGSIDGTSIVTGVNIVDKTPEPKGRGRPRPVWRVELWLNGSAGEAAVGAVQRALEAVVQEEDDHSLSLQECVLKTSW